ncbi:uracil phosphoribosyltransferase [candidate division WOR-3 bacterium]|nr:uracil phosphoribosyltransferase [candidate division WOR-3 bacterium]
MLIEIDSPIAQSELRSARSVKSSKKEFRSAVYKMTSCLFFEASKSIELRRCTVTTPLEKTSGKYVDQSKIALVPILRAGMWMVNPVTDFLPDVSVFPMGIRRNEKTLEPSVYYSSLPPDFSESHVFLLDPMLATGGSASYVCNEILKRRPGALDILTIICAPEGVSKIETLFPGTKIYTVSLDRKLNSAGYILPGLGDAGDRIYG